MKKISLITLIVVLAISLASCTNKQIPNETDRNSGVQGNIATNFVSSEPSNTQSNSTSNSTSNEAGDTQSNSTSNEGGDIQVNDSWDSFSQAGEISKLYDHFLRYATREKPFIWDEFNMALDEDDLFSIKFDGYDEEEGNYFMVFDIDLEGVWLAGIFTTDSKQTDTPGCDVFGDGKLYYIADFMYFANYETDGGIVRFKASGDEYYTHTNSQEKKVKNIDEMLDFILSYTS
ncbi:MAG: hypothetical protein FWG88_11280 [Oscillospiraceae bacterium]|nr:hypothetical protein [Oscillospiraceae bacterium]